MKLDTTEILPESLVWLPALVRDVERAIDLARGAGENASVEVIGHTDLSGDEQRNDLLSTRRADHVRDLLIERGLPAELVSTRGVAARDFTGDPDTEERSAPQPARRRAGAHRIGDGRNRTLIAHKVCMLGSFAVGKTSLVRRFVETLFSDTYQTTVGVKVDKKVVDVHGQPVTLVLWDIQGVEEAEPLRRSYLRGAHGYLVVCDGTRGETLAQCLEIADKAKASIGEVPSLLLVNKADLKDQWEIPNQVLDGLRGKGWQILETSAKDGLNVEEAFQSLASSMVSSIKG